MYRGKVLKDDTSLADNGVTGEGFMVVTVVKPKAPPKPKPAPPPPAAEAATPPAAAAAPAATPSAPAPAAAKPTDGPAADATPPAAATTSADFYQGSASQLAVGAALESSVQMICDMGFEREQVRGAGGPPPPPPPAGRPAGDLRPPEGEVQAPPPGYLHVGGGGVG